MFLILSSVAYYSIAELKDLIAQQGPSLPWTSPAFRTERRCCGGVVDTAREAPPARTDRHRPVPNTGEFVGENTDPSWGIHG